MYDEHVGTKELNELDKYLIENPNDTPALMFSAYCEDKKRWYDQLQYLNDEITSTQNKIVALYKQLDNLTKWQNFWKKMFNKEGHSDDINNKIQSLKNYMDDVYKQLIKLSQAPPKDWEYKLGVLKNNLFKMG